MPQDYIIAGGTGMVGAEVIRQILDEKPDARVFALGRREPLAKHQRLLPVPFDFTGSVQWPKEIPVKPIAICALGTTIKKAGTQEAFRKVDFDFVVRFAEIAQELNAISFHLVTAHGASSQSAIFYNRVKGEVEARLSAMKLRALHIYRPSLLIGDRHEQRAGEGVAIMAARFFGPVFKLPGLKAIEPTPATKLAQVILAQAETPATGNHVHSNQEIMAA